MLVEAGRFRDKGSIPVIECLVLLRLFGRRTRFLPTLRHCKDKKKKKYLPHDVTLAQLLRYRVELLDCAGNYHSRLAMTADRVLTPHCWSRMASPISGGLSKFENTGLYSKLLFVLALRRDGMLYGEGWMSDHKIRDDNHSLRNASCSRILVYVSMKLETLANICVTL